MVEEAQRQRTTFPDAREQFTANQGYQRTVVDPIVRRRQDLVKSYEGTGITPQTFPDWAPHDLMNPLQSFTDLPVGGKSWLGSPMWMDAGTKWKQNIPLMLRSLKQRDEFKDWSDDELTHYMHRIFSNRGGLVSLV